MNYRVTFNNPGGEIDHRDATSPEDAASKAIEMIEQAGGLEDGDSITIEEVKD